MFRALTLKNELRCVHIFFSIPFLLWRRWQRFSPPLFPPKICRSLFPAPIPLCTSTAQSQPVTRDPHFLLLRASFPYASAPCSVSAHRKRQHVCFRHSDFRPHLFVECAHNFVERLLLTL